MADRLCNKAQMDGPLRCERQHGHSGDHANHTGAPVPVTWENHRDHREARLRSRRRPNKETYEHELSEAFTDGIKAAEISRQLEVYGYAFCTQCKDAISRFIATPVNPAAMDEYEAALSEAMTNSAKHHTMGRVGHGYRPDKHGNRFGHDSPLLIEAPVCHRCHTGPASEIHPGPQLGRGAA